MIMYGDGATAHALGDLMNPIVDTLASYPGISKKLVEKILIPDWTNAAINAASLVTTMTVLGAFSNWMTSTWSAPLATNAIPNLWAPPAQVSGKGQMKVTNPESLQRRHEPGAMEMSLGSGTVTMDSRLLFRKHIEMPLDRIADYLERAMPKDKLDGQLRLHFNLQRRVALGGNETSVLPAWRKAYVHIISTAVGGAESPAFREWAPDTGAYVNEVSLEAHCVLETLANH
jgi:hypothetical protein